MRAINLLEKGILTNDCTTLYIKNCKKFINIKN